MQDISSIQTQEISRRLSNILDCLGYSSQMIKYRKVMYLEQENKVNANLLRGVYAQRFVGSKAEGNTKGAESDIDMLQMIPGLICIDGNVPLEWFPFPVSVLKMIPCSLHPGHFKLLEVQKNVANFFRDHCFQPSETGTWFSRKDAITQFDCGAGDIKGPAVCKIHKCGHSHDLVMALPCYCPSIVQKWVHRIRKHDWPPADVKNKISNMTANLVATGIHGCPDESLEWRLCFNEIELELVDSWNDTQTKLYKLLKIVKANTFKEPENKITSFILKNLVFWLSEYYPQSNFRPENLFAWFVKTIRLLKRCVKYLYLPYYMFPSRNLIIEKVPKYQKDCIIKQLNTVIAEGPHMLYRCESLAWSISMTPAELLIFKEKRDEIEMLEFSRAIIDPSRIHICLPKVDSLVLREIESKMYYLLTSEWPPAVQNILGPLTLHKRYIWMLS